MGNLNFQDEKPDEEKPTSSPENQQEEEKVQDIFVDEPTSGMKILWVAIAVVVIAGIGGAFYLLSRHGYLDLGKKAAVTTVAQPPSSTAAAVDTSATAASTAKVQETQATTGRYSLQVAAFRTKGKADHFVARLRKKGIDAYSFAGRVRNEGQWFKVCVGSFPNRIQAIAAVESMKKKVGTNVWVVPAQ